MKKLIAISGFLFLLLPIYSAGATTTVTVDDNAGTVTVGQNQPGVLNATPVVIAKEENPMEFEGEIIQINYPKSQILVHDTGGRDRRVIVKQGMINNYKVDDYVQVRLMADLREAKMIHTVQDASHFEGVIVSVDPVASHIIVRDRTQTDRTVLLASGMTANFKAGDRVRIYVVPEYKEARLIRIV